MNLTKASNVGEKMSTKEYHGISGRISSTDIRLFNTSRKQFYKQVILQERVIKDNTVATLVGSICDCLLTCPEEFDSRYAIANQVCPTGQMGEFVMMLYKRALQTIDSNGVQKAEFPVMFKEALEMLNYGKTPDTMKFKGKTVEKVVELFTNPDKDGAVGELYWQELLANTGKTVVSIEIIQTAENKAKELRECPYTNEIINKESTEQVEIINQLMIMFEYMGIEMRAMLDKTEINHIEKYIQPYDIKCKYDNTQFKWMYINEGIYIQAACYDQALEQYAVQRGLVDYEIRPMKYPVCDTQNENVPLMYELTDEDIEKAYTGFKMKDGHKWFKGLNELLGEIAWHNTNSVWNMSKEIYEKQGQIKMEYVYE